MEIYLTNLRFSSSRISTEQGVYLQVNYIGYLG